MKRIIGAALSAALATGAAACSDMSPPSGPDEATMNAPPGTLVSNALAARPSVSSMGARSSLALSAGRVAYVSALPGTFPHAVSVSIRNETTRGPSRSVEVLDGGFDPVGIDAEADNELSLTALAAGGGLTVMAVRVPPRRPPGVVRTRPGKGRTDVALNVQVLVVFSEPVQPSSVTSSSFALRREGVVVSGRVQVAPDGLSAEFIPDSPLQPETSYELTIDQTIRDVDGDALDEPAVVPFTTGRPLPPLPTLPGQIVTDNLTLMNADGSGAVELGSGFPRGINVGGYGGFSPSWSPDGSRLVFSTNQCYHNFDGDWLCPATDPGGLVIMNPETREIMTPASGAIGAQPAWSPTGEMIAFVRHDVEQLFVIRLDGSEPKGFFIPNVHYVASPTWSPDGGRIAFTCLSATFGICVINSDGTGFRRLANDAFGQRFSPEWSPDGSRIAFYTSIGPNPTLRIAIMAADGSGVTQLTDGMSPRWSADGTKLVFVRYGETGLFSINADGSNLTRSFNGRPGRWRPQRTAAYRLELVNDEPLPVKSPYGAGEWDYDSDAGTWQLFEASFTLHVDGTYTDSGRHRARSGAISSYSFSGTYTRTSPSTLQLDGPGGTIITSAAISADRLIWDWGNGTVLTYER